MGVIYAAYDPQLERPVAVKVVHVPVASGSDALAEAKALARLSHPNVVTIHDYGFVDEHLYIVMELVLGQTLRRWAKGRTQREIVKAYRQAGEALAAAHSVGLVHRDFKPDNAIMGRDGRVRVVDFGLACEGADSNGASPAPRRSAGTPGYMAPEQVNGGALTAATDQFGFCTSLRDALLEQGGGGAGTPRWLQAVIERGRAPNPADRFPSMQALLHGLSRDPAQIRRRWVVAGLSVGGAAVAVAVGSSMLAARETICEGGEDRLAAVWGRGGREAALDRVAKISPYGSSLRPRLERALVKHARGWAAGYREACLAGTRSLQSPALVDRRMACLDRGRTALTSVANIVNTATADDVSDLILAVQALPQPDACSDLSAVLAEAEPPPAGTAPRVEELRRQIEDARIQIAAGRARQVRELTEGTVSAARALEYKPLLSEALLVRGRALMDADERVAAIAPLSEAYTTAFESGLSSLAVEAWARWAWTRGTSIGGEDSLSGLAIVEAVAAQRSTSRFSRALLYNNLGGVELALQRRDRARAAFERASREARGLEGAGSLELLNVNSNLGLVTDDPSQRDRILADSVAEKARWIGEDHPETLNTRWLRGKENVRFERALQILEPTCGVLQTHRHFRAAHCWLEVGFIRHELGDVAGGVDALRRAAAAEAALDSPLPLIRLYLLSWQGQEPAAERGFGAALEARPSSAQEAWWDRLERAELELGLGRVLRSKGELREAQRVLGSSLDGLCAIMSKSPSFSTQRRVTRARAELAKVLFAVEGSSAAASELAGAAASGLRQAGGEEREIEELEMVRGAPAASGSAIPDCNSSGGPTESQ